MSSSEENICPICLEHLSGATGAGTTGAAITTTKCKHKFHTECLNRVHAKGNCIAVVCCPMCRKHLYGIKSYCMTCDQYIVSTEYKAHLNSCTHNGVFYDTFIDNKNIANFKSKVHRRRHVGETTTLPVQVIPFPVEVPVQDFIPFPTTAAWVVQEEQEGMDAIMEYNIWRLRRAEWVNTRADPEHTNLEEIVFGTRMLTDEERVWLQGAGRL